MNTSLSRTRMTLAASALIAISLLSGCANMTHRQKNTAIGATAGAVLGSVLTGGGTVGTLGGAAIGGVIGHQSR